MPSLTFHQTLLEGIQGVGSSDRPEGAVAPRAAGDNASDMRQALAALLRHLAEGCMTAALDFENGKGKADIIVSIPGLVDFTDNRKCVLTQNFVTAAINAIRDLEEIACGDYIHSVSPRVWSISESLLGCHRCRVVVPHPLRHYAWTTGLSDDAIQAGQFFEGRVLAIHHESAVMGHVTHWRGSGIGSREPFVVPVEALTPWWD